MAMLTNSEDGSQRSPAEEVSSWLLKVETAQQKMLLLEGSNELGQTAEELRAAAHALKALQDTLQLNAHQVEALLLGGEADVQVALGEVEAELKTLPDLRRQREELAEQQALAAAMQKKVEHEIAEKERQLSALAMQQKEAAEMANAGGNRAGELMKEAVVKMQAAREQEEKARREAEERARKEAEEKARREAEEKARREAEEKARREAEERARREAEEKARREAEDKERREAEERARREAEERVRKEAEERARCEEERARKEAEEKARREEEERVRKEAEDQARRESEERARQESEKTPQQAEEARKEAEKTLHEAGARKEAEEMCTEDTQMKEEKASLGGEVEMARQEPQEESSRIHIADMKGRLIVRSELCPQVNGEYRRITGHMAYQMLGKEIFLLWLPREAGRWAFTADVKGEQLLARSLQVSLTTPPDQLMKGSWTTAPWRTVGKKMAVHIHSIH